MSDLSIISRKHVPSIPAALKALAAMERELSQASTYTEIRKVIAASEALKLLFGDVNIIKDQAEDVILAASARIGEELQKVPKGRGPGGVKGSKAAITSHGKSSRKDVMPSGTSRARYQKLAENKSKLKAIAKNLRAKGKDVTVTAVVRELTQGDKKERRAARERELGERLLALPDLKFGVVLEDYEWDFEVYSRETGMDRHAANHYPVSVDAHTADEIVQRTTDRMQVAADNCALFMYTTVPHMAIAVDVLRKRGFRYVTNWTWDKIDIGTGYWNRNRHEILLLGIRGEIPCPAPGEQWESLVSVKATEHSAKPEWFLEMIESYFPTLPKIELNRRGPPRPGWYAWGNEVKEAAE